MYICIYSNHKFASSDGEHVLQNSLGARWTSNEIVCNQLQKRFGRTIDVELEHNFKVIRNLFGVKGGRGEQGPDLKKVAASSGEVLDIEPGFRPRLREPIVKTRPLPDGKTSFSIQLGDVGQLGWALKKLRDQGCNVNVDSSTLQSLGRSVKTLVRGGVNLPQNFGGSGFFRGMLKACFNLFGVNYHHLVTHACFDEVKKFVRVGLGESREFVRWSTSMDQLTVPRLGPIDQGIFMTSRDKSLEGVAQFYGHIVYGFRLASNYDGPSVKCGYIVDPLRESTPAENREPDFDAASIPEYESLSEQITDEVLTAGRQSLSRIQSVLYDRARAVIVNEIFNEILGPHEGEPFTKELANKLTHTLAARLAR